MKKEQSGFSLIEIMITLAIAGILLSFGIPNLRGLIIRQSISTKANDMLVDFTFARSEAITSGVPVTIIANTTWDKGWKIVTDNNRDGIEEVIRLTNTEENSIVLSDSNATTPITFNPTGSLKSSISREILIKHNSVIQTKTLEVSLSGNMSIR